MYLTTETFINVEKETIPQKYKEVTKSIPEEVENLKRAITVKKKLANSLKIYRGRKSQGLDAFKLKFKLIFI